MGAFGVTQFIDGPAVGVVLQLQRAPLFLRAVHTPGPSGGSWDALDMHDDRPESHETIVAYRRASQPFNVHIKRSRKAGGSGWFTGASYAVCPEQPPDDVLRGRTSWESWAWDQSRLSPPRPVNLEKIEPKPRPA